MASELTPLTKEKCLSRSTVASACGSKHKPEVRLSVRLPLAAVLEVPEERESETRQGPGWDQVQHAPVQEPVQLHQDTTKRSDNVTMNYIVNNIHFITKSAN